MVGFLTLLLSLFTCQTIYAGVALEEGTRIVFSSTEQLKTIHVMNTNNYQVVVQSWVDDGNLSNTPSNADAPLITKPALFTLEPGETQGIQLINVDPQALEKERLYWLNLHELPPSLAPREASLDKLALTMQTQYKVFYRGPETALTHDGIKQSINVDKEVVNGSYCLIIENLSSIHLNLSKIETGGRTYKRFNRTVPPRGTLKLMSSTPLKDNLVMLTVIDDNGAHFDVLKYLERDL
ncbi:fimbrial biogenesis chaperone [Salinivibrio sp. IB872]|jgi:P pilus assembly chaperone PapD|uniref:fimbrial biogenesis chaperone n=1 Tax=Salinivibrio sp. IB872 TaxID=1766123 RepID=UPI000984BAD0|nr:molecular chaperone [Salinivibrio sp. IB872]OOF24160.1 hypothetical protein BZJ18_13570 [Salinivibrio sp. IB872]